MPRRQSKFASRLVHPNVVFWYVTAGLLGFIVYFFLLSPPSVNNAWSSVIDAYPDGSIECHVAVMDRVRHISDLLDYSHHVSNNASHKYQTIGSANELAVRMVAESERQPPECAATRP